MFKHITARLRVLRSGLRSSEKGVPAQKCAGTPFRRSCSRTVRSPMSPGRRFFCPYWLTHVNRSVIIGLQK